MRGRIKKASGVSPREGSKEGMAKRVSYHTKRYTDWAKETIKNGQPVDAVVPKEEPTVLERFDYTKEKGVISTLGNLQGTERIPLGTSPRKLRHLTVKPPTRSQSPRKKEGPGNQREE